TGDDDVADERADDVGVQFDGEGVALANGDLSVEPFDEREEGGQLKVGDVEWLIATVFDGEGELRAIVLEEGEAEVGGLWLIAGDVSVVELQGDVGAGAADGDGEGDGIEGCGLAIVGDADDDLMCAFALVGGG